MSEPESWDPLTGQLIGAMRQAQAAMIEATRPPRYEYILVDWDHVNERAREGWQLVPIPPKGDFWWVMQRQLGAADEAAEMLKETGQ